MTVIDVDAAQVALVAGLLAEVGTATADLCADLRLPIATAALRARQTVDGWQHLDAGPRPPRRRSWRAWGTRAG